MVRKRFDDFSSWDTPSTSTTRKASKYSIDAWDDDTPNQPPEPVQRHRVLPTATPATKQAAKPNHITPVDSPSSQQVAPHHEKPKEDQESFITPFEDFLGTDEDIQDEELLQPKSTDDQPSNDLENRQKAASENRHHGLSAMMRKHAISHHTAIPASNQTTPAEVPDTAYNQQLDTDHPSNQIDDIGTDTTSASSSPYDFNDYDIEPDFKQPIVEDQPQLTSESIEPADYFTSDEGKPIDPESDENLPWSIPDGHVQDDNFVFDDSSTPSDDHVDGNADEYEMATDPSNDNEQDDPTDDADEVPIQEPEDSDQSSDDEPNQDDMKHRLGSLWHQIKSDLTGGDDQSSHQGGENNQNDRHPKQIGSGTSHPSIHPIHWLRSIINAVFSLLHITGRIAKIGISLGFILILAWLVLNIITAFDKGSSIHESHDEGVVSVVSTSWHDASLSTRVTNHSDLIAHITGKAIVKAWSPNLNPISLVNPSVIATCSFTSLDVNPGATVDWPSTCSKQGSGLWNRISVTIEYQ